MSKYKKSITIDNHPYEFFSLKEFDSAKIHRLPLTIRILLECALRKNSSDYIPQILNWGLVEREEIPFYPSRVLLQDYTGVPAIVDLASMREQVNKFDPSKLSKINPQVPVELVIDHSIQVDSYGLPDSIKINEDKEF